MGANKTNYVKLGAFVLSGLAFLILLLYVIGKNQNLFGKTFALKAHFENVHGLTKGNNIRFAGIDAGTVKNVAVMNDTTVEVTLLVKRSMQAYIHKNAVVSIGTDGLVGNRIVNIRSAGTPAPLAQEGDVLQSEGTVDTEQMLAVLNRTNNDVAAIARQLKQTVERVNNGKMLWSLLEDESLPATIRQTLQRIKSSSDYLNRTTLTLNRIVTDVNEGKGSIGKLLKDSALALSVYDAVDRIRRTGGRADTLSMQITALVATIDREVSAGKGPVNALLKDEQWVQRIGVILENIETDTRSFNQVMDAVKHSFLFRGYFKKLEKQGKQ